MRYGQTLTRRAPLTLTLCVALLALTACGGLTPSGARIDEPPAGLLMECEGPIRLPHRDAAQWEVEQWWRTDRARLLGCAERHDGLRGWARDVIAAVRGERVRENRDGGS